MNLLLGLSLAGFVASLTSAAIGVGGGLLVMPILVLIFPPRLVIATTAPMFWANAIFTLYLYRKTFWIKRAAVLIPGVIIGILIGTDFVQIASPVILRRTIGIIALVFLALSVFLSSQGRKRIVELPMWIGVPASLLSGVVSSLSNIGGTFLSIFIIQGDVEPARFVGAMAFFYFIMTSVKMIVFSSTGLLTWKEIPWVIPSVGGIALGAVLGKTINRHISPQNFRFLIMGIVSFSSILLLFTR
ncbi:MAG: hypothetical protein C7B47_14680 [Sulfobacillus thermosulfidooxidans]|uniref:Probable membrane transporter protein n=1 Tax=Sulfobacillus thermosulfidooxidans TaxID=28034 RepID=A0A2T2WQJ4_SULTH|nr:MAG: hypothetical protein C7B47_14680 [Sulfobacillus thermosulfidooxidans]